MHKNDGILPLKTSGRQFQKMTIFAWICGTKNTPMELPRKDLMHGSSICFDLDGTVI